MMGELPLPLSNKILPYANKAKKDENPLKTWMRSDDGYKIKYCHIKQLNIRINCTGFTELKF